MDNSKITSELTIIGLICKYMQEILSNESELNKIKRKAGTEIIKILRKNAQNKDFPITLTEEDFNELFKYAENLEKDTLFELSQNEPYKWHSDRNRFLHSVVKDLSEI